MQSAELRDEVLAGTEVQVVRVAEQDRRAEGEQLVGIDSLDRRLGADRHERRCQDVAVRGADDAGAGGAVGGDDLERLAHSTSIASPKE